MTAIVPIGIVGVLAMALAGAAYTKPSRAELHAAATRFADDTSVVGSVATRVTGLFGNDAYDDYMFFDRYRVYVGGSPTVECYGAFGRTSCQTPKVENKSES